MTHQKIKLEVGDRVTQDINPGSNITVASVASDQPLEDLGLVKFTDQYDETHHAELDGDTWVTASENVVFDALFDRGLIPDE